MVTLVRNIVGSTAPESEKKLLALLNGKGADGNNSLVPWEPVAESPTHLFSRQAIPIAWDYCESTPACHVRGVFLSGVDAACRVINGSRSMSEGQVQLADAADHPLPDESADVFFTDPPYYDAIPYSDLSDFFLVWLKRTLPSHPLLRDPFDPSNPLSPKEREAVQDETKTCGGRVKDRQFFEDVMGQALGEGRRVLRDDGIASIVFAHKTTEGWEALLTGMIRAGWTVTGSWPIATESKTRLRARDSAALATSVHLVCRPRPADAEVGEWARVLRELPGRVALWIERLQAEGIRGADLVFACIGPALEIFSRYSAVETPEGQVVQLGSYLEKVWEVVGRTALAQVLGAGGVQPEGHNLGFLEEDARLTALFLWTHQSSEAEEDREGGLRKKEEEDEPAGPAKGLSLPFDMVRRFAQPMGIDLDRWTERVIGQAKGVVRLRPVLDRASDLFGDAGASAVAGAVETDPVASLQMPLFPDMEAVVPRLSRRSQGRLDIEDAQDRDGARTVLDRLHAAMLFQHGGHASALRKLIKTEQERGPEFIVLANALSALYPRGSREKRLLDAMLLAVPR